MNKPTKDLFDDTTMTFGEHLEALRLHLFKAIAGLVLATIVCLYQGEAIVDYIRQPIDRALKQYTNAEVDDDIADVKSSWRGFLKNIGLEGLAKDDGEPSEESPPEPVDVEPAEPVARNEITVRVNTSDLVKALRAADPSLFPPRAEGEPAPSPSAEPNKGNTVPLKISAPEFAQLREEVDQSQQLVALNVQEPFMTYLKVSLIAGVVLSSPWIFYQMWQFVAAGLYRHERKYVHVYGSMSLLLFLSGAAFCFYLVFPFVLNYLLGFFASMRLTPQLRLSEWVSFVVVLPLMFGISFQLPLVMLFLQRISIFQIEHYTKQRRMAILVIAILSAILTPTDPISMLMMMFPLILLYQMGIVLCRYLPTASPFEDALGA